MVRLVMTWDIRSGWEQAYVEFVNREFVPRLIEWGLTPQEAWYALAGQGPQVVSAVLAPSREELEQILKRPEWAQLLDRLRQYVVNLHLRLSENDQSLVIF